ncbi:putative cytosolic iron-sulfur protein assembly protein CIAO1-like [Heracleum sosnowskyi]|uniref:Cytosolic iron-sulfur protein assembly protein CIAO1-like n=1 Tax=Heracleum sosnowskyi TaxID=360622 RepID=A0AAD8IPC0_9APIA|nr:putative cytosolic iron-sulfur protein assembly protein CIAO1-like [Heracleum sosnowskyi]
MGERYRSWKVTQASSDKTVRIWKQNLITSAFDCVATIRGAQTGTGRSCSWSLDGNLLAIANYDGTTSVWDKAENGFKHLYDLKGHDKEVVSVSWNTSGQLATCSSNSVWIWGYRDSEEIEILNEFKHIEDVEMVQWHPFEDTLFSCGCDKIIKVWERFDDLKHWQFAQDLDYNTPFCRGHLSKVCCISFNATGDKLVTSSADLSIKVWGAERMQSGGGYQPWFPLHGDCP